MPPAPLIRDRAAAAHTHPARHRHPPDAAAHRWPQDADSRSRLLHRLIDLGWTTLHAELATDADAHHHAVDATAGALTGAYGPDYLPELREDCPR